ncbi:MAG: hypothetical protein GXX86_10880 [Propionibacterium sp.]|nr:hypothetical protein [Propionibacterium sp.]
MITPFDDFPIHQTPSPVTQPGTSDPNFYDRFYFGGHDAAGTVVFAAAMGLYPNRNVMDAAFSVVVDGVQHCVFASGPLPRDRHTGIGPISVEYNEPLRVLQLLVDDPESGLRAELTFRARTAAVAEPRQTTHREGVLIMDYTRMSQWGTWSGRISVGDTTLEVSADRVVGVRDRSWGVRPLGDRTPTNLPARTPQVFWLWAPLHFDDVCTHLAAFELANGFRWLEQAVLVPLLDDPAASPTWGADAPAPQLVRNVVHDLTWRPGTREIARAAICFDTADGPQRMELTPVATFLQKGIGYGHPHWLHGRAHGELTVGRETYVLADVDREQYENVHVQTVCRVTWGDREGVGILEQLVLGDHEPSGLTGMYDGWRAG